MLYAIYVIVCLLAYRHSFADASDSEVSEQTESFRYWVVTFAFVFTTVGAALLTEDFGVVLGLVGATGATILQYILPGLSYWILYENDGPEWKRHGAQAMFYAGLIIMPVCVTFIFI